MMVNVRRRAKKRAKKAKQADREESDEDERNKRTLFVNMAFGATDKKVNICLHLF